MAKVVWTAHAVRNLRTIQLYIGEFSPLASQRMAIRLKAATEGLNDFPDKGVPISGGRRQLTQVSPYLIRYQRQGDLVIILDIRHGAEDAS